MYDNIVKKGKPNEELKASNGWLKGFMKRYSLSLQQKTSVAQKNPDQLIDKLVSFVLNVHRLVMKHSYSAADIIAMDDIPIWADMV